MIKMIALDLDGTLLTSQRTISSRTQQVLYQLRQHGIYIVLCTGRAINAIVPYLNDLNLFQADDFSINFNGAVVSNNVTQAALVQRALSKDDLRPLYRLAQKIQAPLDVLDFKRVYSLSDLPQSTYQAALGQLLEFVPTTFATLSAGPFAKVVSKSNAKMTDQLALQIPEVFQHKFHIVRSLPNELEFLKPGVDKATGLSQLLTHLNLSPANLMAFGNEQNDIGMLQLAQVGVVMANAPAAIKTYGTALTTSNDEDGVADFLTHYFTFLT
ncbi:Cof-type HAD-IIB family hydrolase [Loigolactobacillus iwatensis]|uniref:Cof-type HAD-IIB family hydrolase n=1 Tax=Loigolactobacillus iwatensis TaxID=1267156 RepID=UPI000F7E6D33|nr:Cof-type HAD-IIB family hydrolase [Loigolactobacillus iwatensis]